MENETWPARNRFGAGTFKVNHMDPNLYEILLRNLKEAVVFVDAEQRIQIFNRVAEKYFGIPGKKL
ncbi:MAG: PAS domain-containing protein, partial [Desulfobacterales bacterium]|nr:PAS domain-containing protein [Desulfobacterales bacterium]